MIGVIINPGAGPIEGRRTTARDAERNIRAFRWEIGAPRGMIRIQRLGRSHEDLAGRYDFRLSIRNRRDRTDISMPGLPLEEVRFVRGANVNVLRFPRLYVDGNSWLWPFAVSQAREALRLASEDG